jgi:glycine betaine/choline ABC-type transport system substrate-binding protein
VASKDFGENKILAEMFALLISEADISHRRMIPFGNTFDLQEALKAGEIDIYPEYTGTGLAMMGLPTISDGELALETVRELFSPYNAVWLDRLGFNNSYVLTMQTDLAARMGVEKIGDLVKHSAEIKVGCEEEYLARPVDGFQPLVRRYGLAPEPEVVIAEDREQLYRDLITEKTHVAVVQRTDPQIEEFGLKILVDNLDFFSAYEAAPLLREGVLDRFPVLGPAVKQLAGTINNETMRELNRRVELDGLEPRTVAIEFLVQEGLLARRPPEMPGRKLVVAMPPSDYRSTLLARALDAVRRAAPNRRVEVAYFASPAAALLEGEAFIAILGAENFFTVRPGRLPQVIEDIEAVAPIGFRSVHLIRLKDRISKEPFGGVKRLGVGPAKGSSEKAAQMLLDGYGLKKTKLVAGNLDKQISEVTRGKLDGLLLMAASGDARVTLLLEDKRLTLQPVTGWEKPGRQYKYPFLRLARISEETYPGLEKAVDTIGAQVVFAGPRPAEPTLGDGDPVSGLRTQRQRIPLGVREALLTALGRREAIDPTLPGERATLVTGRAKQKSLNPAPEVSLITALFLIGLGGFFYKLSKKTRPK